MRMTPDAIPNEGLPYWTFWLLICVIFLLVAFIFLRDKDLRRRLSYLLSGGKRKVLRLRLQMRLKKEKQRRAGFVKELGSAAWGLDPRPAAGERLYGELRALEEKRASLRAEWQGAVDRLETLRTKAEEAKAAARAETAVEEERKKPHELRWRELKEKDRALEKEIKAAGKVAAKNGAAPAAAAAADAEMAARPDLLRDGRAAIAEELASVQKELETIDGRIGDIREKARVLTRTLEAEVREWERDRDGTQEKIREAERLMEPLFDGLGAIINEARPDHLSLVAFYAKIDRIDKSVRDLTERIAALR